MSLDIVDTDRLVYGDVVNFGAGPLVIVDLGRGRHPEFVDIVLQKGEVPSKRVYLGGDADDHEVVLDRFLEFAIPIDEEAVAAKMAVVKTMITTNDFQEIPPGDYYRIARVLVNIDKLPAGSYHDGYSFALSVSLFDRNLTTYVTKAQIEKLAKDLEAAA